MGRVETSEIFRNAIDEGRKFLFEHEAKNICSLYGIPVTNSILAKNKDAAVYAAEKIGFPVVLKVISPQVIHKSDFGGVILGINDPEEVEEGYERILQSIRSKLPDAVIKGILVQEMAKKGVEIIIGSTRDYTFGQVIMFGVGGVFVEVLKDVSFRLLPLSRIDAEEMIKEIKSYEVLEGVRGAPPSDLEAVTNVLLATSRMLSDFNEIVELDINPMFVYEKGAMVVDARIIL
jgi:acetyl-CoA synthetase (ADP-forming)